jgi:hypothetical protein
MQPKHSGYPTKQPGFFSSNQVGFNTLFLPFSQKTYRKFFDIWEDFRTPFSFVPAVPLLSAYICSVNVGLPPAVKRQRFFATLATAAYQPIFFEFFVPPV